MSKLGSAVAKFIGLEDAATLAQAIASPPAWADSSHLDTQLISQLYGLADSSGIFITRGTANGLPVVAKGRRLLASIGRMTLENHKGPGLAPMQMPYLQQPEEDRPLAETLVWTADALYYRPRTWWIVKRRDAAGWPARGGVKLLKWADAEFDEDGKLVKAWGEPVAPRDVIQFNSPDGGLLHDHHDLIRRAVILNRAASLAEANPVPSVNLENTGSDKLLAPQIVDLLESWMEARKRYGVAYTDKNIKATPMKAAVENLLISGRKQMDLDLSRVIGLPAWAADVPVEGSTINYINRPSKWWELIDLFLAPYMTAITARLTMNDCTPIGWTTQLNTDELTRPSQSERFDMYKVGRDGDFIDQAWIEAQEGQQLRSAQA